MRNAIGLPQAKPPAHKLDFILRPISNRLWQANRLPHQQMGSEGGGGCSVLP